MSSPDLDQAIVELVSKQKVKVPPYPAVAFRIESVVRSGNFGLDDLAKLVSSDQVLAADVLRCGNSALYARGAPVASVKQAVGRIGAKDVARLALASGLGAHALAAGPLSSLRRRVWLDALASAILCQDLARTRKLAPDVAFAAGLLHDFGKVVAIACLEEILQQHPDAAARTEAEWTALVESYHLELGVVMAARWDLPQVIGDAISMHHSSDASSAADPQVVQVVVLVDHVISLLGALARIGPDELEVVETLSLHEREVLARSIELLPGLIASFESGEAWKGDGRGSLVAAPEPPREAAGKPPPHRVVLKLGANEHAFTLVGIGATQCMVRGKGTVPLNLLMELTIACQPPLQVYASVKLAVPEQDGFLLLISPFGLTQGAQARWQQLMVESAG